MLFLMMLVQVLRKFRIKFDAPVWVHCFSRCRDFCNIIFQAADGALQPSQVLALFKHTYARLVRPRADVARAKLYDRKIKMGSGPDALRKYEVAFRATVRHIPDMSQADVLENFRRGLTPDLATACLMDSSGRPFTDFKSMLDFAYGLERIKQAQAQAASQQQRMQAAGGPQLHSAVALSHHPAAPSLKFNNAKHLRPRAPKFKRQGNNSGRGRNNAGPSNTNHNSGAGPSSSRGYERKRRNSDENRPDDRRVSFAPRNYNNNRGNNRSERPPPPPPTASFAVLKQQSYHFASHPDYNRYLQWGEFYDLTGNGEKTRCFNCLQYGHISKACPNARRR